MNTMKCILTALLFFAFGDVYCQPKAFTADEAKEHIATEKFYLRVPLKWIPDSCTKKLEAVNCQVYFAKAGTVKTIYDSIMDTELTARYGELWEAKKHECYVCLTNYYSKYQGPYSLDGDILDPSTAKRHIEEGKLYYLVCGSSNPEHLPSGFFECEEQVYEALGLEIKWISGLHVELVSEYNKYIMTYLDSVNQTTGTGEKSGQAFIDCLENWDKKK